MGVTMDRQLCRAKRQAVTILLCTAFSFAPLTDGLGATKGRSDLMTKAGVTEISAAQLRVRMRGLAAPFSGILEEAADAVIAGTDDHALQQEGD